jgi:hypothetical protein
MPPEAGHLPVPASQQSQGSNPTVTLITPHESDSDSGYDNGDFDPDSSYATRRGD